MLQVLRFLLRLTARLPLPLLHAFGTALGWLVYGTSPTYRRRLRANLAQAGYVDSRTRHEAIASAGKLITEIPALWFRRHADVAALVLSAPGWEEPIALQAQGRPVLLLTPHMGSFEAAGQYAALKMRIAVLYRVPRMEWLEPLLREGRGRPNVRLARADLSGVRELFSALKRGETVGLLPDQVPGEGEGEWSEFFGRPAYTMTLAAKLAAREHIACFLVFARRLPRGAGYALSARPLPAALPGESATRRVNRALEELVRECPGQYLWGYNRYKKPRGAEPFAQRARPSQ